MNVSLCQLYVARKLAMSDLLLDEARKGMSRAEFKAFVMNLPVSEVSMKVLNLCRKNIERTFKLQRRALLFPRPTVRQWISDICRDYQADDLISFFSQATGVDEKKLRRDSIDSTLINRPYLISLVEKLEEATGKTLLSLECPRPLEYLGDMPYLEIARYFASSSEAVIQKRREACLDEKYFCGKFLRDALGVYRQMAEVDEALQDEDLLTHVVSDFHPKDFGESDWDLPIFWMEDLMKIQLPATINKDTTISQLLDMVVSEKLKSLHKK